MKRLLKAPLLALLLTTAATTTNSHAVFSLNDIRHWTGTGTNEAIFVLDWQDSKDALAWGYRWDDSTTLNSNQMLLSILGADARLTADFTSTSFGDFLNGLHYDANQDGDLLDSTDHSASTPADFSNYWALWVNNPIADPPNYDATDHLFPHTGNPTNGGQWAFSTTGALNHTLTDGAWVGFVFSDGSIQPSEPIAAIPEAQSSLLALLSLSCLFLRRKWSTTDV